jgi:hypothetical protein
VVPGIRDEWMRLGWRDVVEKGGVLCFMQQRMMAESYLLLTPPQLVEVLSGKSAVLPANG